MSQEADAKVEITTVEYLKPELSKFGVSPQTAMAQIARPTGIEEVQVSVTAGDVIPVIPNILTKTLEAVIMKDWKTTLIGVAGGAIIALGDYVQSGGTITLKGALAAVGFAVLGWFSSDSKKSGQ